MADLYYKRTILLILFGLFDAFLLLWTGDILYIYGVVGLFLFPFRNVKSFAAADRWRWSCSCCTAPQSCSGFSDFTDMQAAAAEARGVAR